MPLAGLVLPVTLLCAVADFFIATALESSRGGSAISLTDPGVLRTVAGSSLYLTVIVIIALALGALLRRTSSRGSPPTCPTPAGSCGATR